MLEPPQPERVPLVDVVTDPGRRHEFEASGQWVRSTLDALVTQHACRAPNRVAVVDQLGERQVTYAQLDSDADRVVALLMDLGVRAGDVVAVQMPNWYETVAIDIGVLRVGAIINPMLPLYRGNELSHMLALPATRVLFSPARYNRTDHRQVVTSLAGNVPTLQHHVLVAAPDGDGSPFLSALPTPAQSRSGPRAADAVSELMYTSGTEAQPKAIMHTEQTTNFAVRDTVHALGLSSEDVVWMPSPLGHSTGLNYGMRVALHQGLPLVLQDRWDRHAAARLVRDHRCSYTVAATTFLSDLLRTAREDGIDVCSLRLAASGGAPIPTELVDAAEKFGIGVLRIYGSTELLAATWSRPGSPRAKRIATDGVPSPGIEVQVRGEDGTPLVGAPGEIFARGPQTCVGYYRDPERTAATFGEDGWVRTGDLGILDEDGYVTVVGRRKEIIIRGGLNIAPREIEELLALMPQIEQVAVVGLPDERLGETMCVCVVPAADITLPDITAHLDQLGLARFKWPERLVHFDVLPTTETGKIKKFELVRIITAENSQRNQAC